MEINKDTIGKTTVTKLSKDTFVLAQEQDTAIANMNVSGLLNQKKNLEEQLAAVNELIAKVEAAGITVEAKKSV